MPRRTAADAERTRLDLIEAGCVLFADPGFTATTLDAIVQWAGVTRGAFYHHFASKELLFEAVFEVMQARIAEDVAAAALRKRSALSRFRAGCDAFLDTCLEPDVARIVLLDGPSVLGWERWRLLDTEHGRALVVGGITAVMAAGELRRQPAEPLGNLLLGALTHAGMSISRAADPAAERAAMGSAFGRLIDGLVQP